MADQDQGEKISEDSHYRGLLENCPHCDCRLSAWEQVLLKVDGALICKKCWYRIHLNGYSSEKKSV